MSSRGVAAWLSLAHQAVSLEVEFGRHALEALVGIAETVEESVYEPGSLLGTSRGVAFALSNPPLRAGAFAAVRVELNGIRVPPTALSLRPGEGQPWTSSSRISPASPFEFHPGRRTEVRVEPLPAPIGGTVRVRLELESAAIPPLVWFEFHDTVRAGHPA